MAEENREANDRTEDPTPRRLEEAVRRGDVVKSMEVNTWHHRRRHAGDHGVRCADGVEPADHVPGAHCQIVSNPDRRRGADSADEDTRLRCRRRFLPAASGSVRRRFRRQHRAAPHRVHDRIGQAATVANFADGRLRSSVLQTGAGEYCQGAGQAVRGLRRHGGAVVAATPPDGSRRYSRSGDAAAVHPLVALLARSSPSSR